MTAVLYDVAVAYEEAAPVVATAPTLQVVRDESRSPAPKKVARQVGAAPFGVGGDPLVDGAARLLSVPLRHVYAALWRVGFLEVQNHVQV